MLGLGGYESSGDEDTDHQAKPKASIEPLSVQVENGAPKNASPAPQQGELNDVPGATPSPPINGAPEGPMVGPAPAASEPQDDVQDGSQSPYLTERTLVHNLTMPPIPNLHIPPSPPGSPDPVANQKFKHFLDLKSQGTHFNEKLASSSSLKNPSLLNKLMEHAGISDMEQYATSLPTDIWDPSNFPSWAFKEELLKASQDLTKREEERRAKGQRDTIDFVSGTASGDSSRGGTPGGGKGLRVSAAERVIAGLSRESTRSPMGSAQGMQKDSRRGRERAPSPKRRKRSRSR